MSYIYTSEGRITINGTAAQYEFALKDHLGNSRVWFSDMNDDGVVDVNHTAATSDELIQEEHYYPFGLRMNGGWEVQTGAENAYQFNGIEKVGDFGLGWEVAHFRTYDATLGRWGQVDPKASERESAYVGMGNSPVLYSDMMGDTVKFAGEEEEKLYNDFKKNTAVNIVRNVLLGNLKGAATYGNVLFELDELEKSEDVYRIRTGKNSTSKEGDEEGGSFKFNVSTFELDINIDDKLYPIAYLAHEIKHAYQFHTDKLAFSTDGNSTRPEYYDKTDEIEAYERQMLYQPDFLDIVEFARLSDYLTYTKPYKSLPNKSKTGILAKSSNADNQKTGAESRIPITPGYLERLKSNKNLSQTIKDLLR